MLLTQPVTDCVLQRSINLTVDPQVEASMAFFQVYDGAVYLHQGRPFLCIKLDLSSKVALVRPADVKYYTKINHFKDVYVTGGATFEQLLDRFSSPLPNSSSLIAGALFFHPLPLPPRRRSRCLPRSNRRCAGGAAAGDVRGVRDGAGDAEVHGLPSHLAEVSPGLRHGRSVPSRRLVRDPSRVPEGARHG